MGMLASGTMSSAHVEGLPDYPFPRKASKLFYFCGRSPQGPWVTVPGPTAMGCMDGDWATPHLALSGLCNSPLGQRSLQKPHRRRA